MKANKFSPVAIRPMSRPEMAGQTVRGGRLVNVGGYGCDCRTGISKAVEANRMRKRMEKMEVMTQAMVNAELNSDMGER